MITYKSAEEIEQLAESARLVSTVLLELKKKLRRE
jgi:methionine aminopeptidase